MLDFALSVWLTAASQLDVAVSIPVILNLARVNSYSDQVRIREDSAGNLPRRYDLLGQRIIRSRGQTCEQSQVFKVSGRRGNAMANYDIAEHWDNLSSGKKTRVINLASREQLEKWASDPDCNQQLLCADALKNVPQIPPFDPHTEVSADARHIAGRIVQHLWIIFVVLPFVLAILYEILKSA